MVFVKENRYKHDMKTKLTGLGVALVTPFTPSGEVDFEALKSALQAINYTGALTAEMIPFCRLPDLVLPDEALAKVTAAKMVELFGK